MNFDFFTMLENEFLLSDNTLRVSDIVMLFELFIKDKPYSHTKFDIEMYKRICQQISEKFNIDEDDTRQISFIIAYIAQQINSKEIGELQNNHFETMTAAIDAVYWLINTSSMKVPMDYGSQTLQTYIQMDKATYTNLATALDELIEGLNLNFE